MLEIWISSSGGMANNLWKGESYTSSTPPPHFSVLQWRPADELCRATPSPMFIIWEYVWQPAADKKIISSKCRCVLLLWSLHHLCMAIPNSWAYEACFAIICLLTLWICCAWFSWNLLLLGRSLPSQANLEECFYDATVRFKATPQINVGPGYRLNPDTAVPKTRNGRNVSQEAIQHKVWLSFLGKSNFCTDT